VGILLLDFHFPMAVASRSCGNVEIAQVDFQGLVDGEGNLYLVFLAAHSPAFPQLVCCSRDFPLPDVGEQFLFGPLHRDGGLRIALRFSQPVEFFDREIFFQKPGQSR
jgi:hypothetical protein